MVFSVTIGLGKKPSVTIERGDIEAAATTVGEIDEHRPLLPTTAPHKVAWSRVRRESEAVFEDISVDLHIQQAINIFEAAESGAGLNVYHMTAFFPLSSNYTRALLCIVLQVVVVPYIIADTFFNKEKEMCPMDGSGVGKVSGAALLLYAVYQLFAQHFSMEHAWDQACICAMA